MTREEIIGKVLDTVLWTRNASGDNKNILTNALVKALEKEPILDKIRAEIKTMSGDIETIADVLAIIDKCKGESAEEDNKKIMPWYLEPFKQAIETYKGESEK